MCMGVAAGPSIGHAQVELFLPFPTAAGMAVSGAAVSASEWAAETMPALSSRAVHLASPFGTRSENGGSYG